MHNLPSSLKELLSGWHNDIFKKKDSLAFLREAWQKYHPNSYVLLELQGQELYIKTSSSIFLSDLRFQQTKILEQLNQSLSSAGREKLQKVRICLCTDNS